MTVRPPTTTSERSERVRHLTEAECRTWLRAHHEGRLGYLSGRGPRSVVVTYDMGEDRILFCVPDYNEIAHYAPQARVTLEVAGLVPQSLRGIVRDSVTVSGVAAVAEEQHQPPSSARERWPAGLATAVISLPMTRLDGVAEPVTSRAHPMEARSRSADQPAAGQAAAGRASGPQSATERSSGDPS